jgi:hypothetical protein
MPPETEVIKQQMGQTRAALTEKLESLENQVFGTVHNTTNTLSSTVQNVGDTVKDTVRDVRATVSETMASVRDALDVTRQIHRHPWLMMGGSVFAGYVGGRLLESLEAGRFPSRLSLPAEPSQYLPAEGEREAYEPSPAPPRSGSSFFHSLAETFAPEIAKLKGMAVGVAVGLMRDKLSESVPPQFQQNVTDLMDRFTVKLGGEPTPLGSMSLKSDDREERDGPETRRSMGRI